MIVRRSTACLESGLGCPREAHKTSMFAVNEQVRLLLKHVRSYVKQMCSKQNVGLSLIAIAQCGEDCCVLGSDFFHSLGIHAAGFQHAPSRLPAHLG